MNPLHKFKAPEFPINFYNTQDQIMIPNEYHEKPFRAMWVSNVMNIDLPTTENPEAYKSAIIQMLDTALEYNLTAIFFQVRTTNDAFYDSKLNPFSRFLTGKEGRKPPFDVMEYVVEETHKRGLEFHAWCNPYRVSMNSKVKYQEYLSQCDDKNFAKQNPDLVVLDPKGQIILNPAKEEVKQFIVDSMKELAANYDVDGIHWDDYFYPYAGLDSAKDDAVDFENRMDKSQTIGDFRRMHVTDVIKRVHQAIHSVSKNKRFGVSPFGIWKNKPTDPKGSNTDPKCSESYSNQYADSYLWVKEEMIDYMVPQIYWPFGHPIAPFADILKFWVSTVKGTNVDLYIGHGAYRLGEEGDFENPMEIVNQVKFANAHSLVSGNVFFTYKTFLNKDKSFKGMQNLKKLLLKVDKNET